MSEYIVTWEINVEADSPKEAAEEAHRIMLDPDSIATYFLVKSGTKRYRKRYRVMLGDYDPIVVEENPPKAP